MQQPPSDDREGSVTKELGDAVADTLARRDDGVVGDDPAFGVALGPDDPDIEVAGVARTERLRDARLAQRGGRELGAAGRSQRVDRDADDDDVAGAHVDPTTLPTKASAGSVTLFQ